MPQKFENLIEKKMLDYEAIVSALDIDDSKRKIIIANWCDSIRLMEVLTKRHHSYYNLLNFTTIIGSILIPVAINVLPDPISKYISTVIGILVSVSAGLNQSYRCNDRWKLFRKVSEELKFEGENYIALAGAYSSFTSHKDESFKLFMQNVILIKQSQISDYFRKIDLTEKNQPTNDEKKKISDATLVDAALAKNQ